MFGQIVLTEFTVGVSKKTDSLAKQSLQRFATGSHFGIRGGSIKLGKDWMSNCVGTHTHIARSKRA